MAARKVGLHGVDSGLDLTDEAEEALVGTLTPRLAGLIQENLGALRSVGRMLGG